MGNKILIVDDEKGIVTLLKNYFEEQGYQVYTANGAEQALEKIAFIPDIILLDINMPNMDGLSLCKHIREYVSCPILFLTARIETEDKITGFEVGGDDYIVKPFELDELHARVEAHLRRENRKQKQTRASFFGDMIVDYSKREVQIKDQVLGLSKKEFEIVELLSCNPNQVFDRERIYDIIWGLEGDGNSDTIMEHISRIRKKIAEFLPHNYIETVWGVGYRWNG